MGASSQQHATPAERLYAELAALTSPNGDIAAPGTAALAWFRSAWPELAACRAAEGDDAEIVRFTRAATPFLAAVENWDGLVDIAQEGLAAAARRAADDDVRYLRQVVAVALQRAGRDAEAGAMFEELADTAAARGDHRAEGVALAHRGQLLMRHGDPHAAAALFQRAALAYRLAGHRLGEARAAGELARTLARLGSDEEAVGYAKRAAAMFREAGDRAGEAKATLDLAGYHARRGATEEALRLYSVAAERSASVDDAAGAVEALQAVARLHLRAHDYNAARRAADAALDHARSAADPSVAELADFLEGVTALAAVDALLAADTDVERAAIVVERPEALGGLVQYVLMQRRDEDAVPRERIDAALAFLRDHPGSAAAAEARARLDELRAAAGPAAELLPPELSAQLARLAATEEPDVRAAVLGEAIAGLPESEPGLAPPRGVLQLRLAKAVGDGGAAAARDQAIAIAREAAHLLDGTGTRRRWAECQVFLGTALRNREAGDLTDVEEALGAFRRALTVFRRASDPLEWATTMVNLANAYWRRGGGAADLTRALRRHWAALGVLSRAEYPGLWATVQSNIGLVLTEPVLAANPENLEAGRRHLLDAVGVPELDASARASALINLARCSRDRLADDPEDNIDAAVRYSREAYEIRLRIGNAVDVAIAANAVGDAVGNAALRARRDPRAAAEWFERALRLAPVDAAPLVHAAAADNLAGVLVQADEVPAAHLHKAITLHDTAIRLYAATGERLEEARACYNVAATLRRTDPPDNAAAVAYLERSLRVRTPDLVPLEWAASVTELARTWLNRSDGPDPLRAVELLRPVVEVLGDSASTGHSRRAWGLLGDACSDLGRWSEAADAYQKALAAAEVRYRATILPGGRDAELEMTADLAREGAYATAAAGDAVAAAGLLEAARARALGDRLTRDRADLTALETAEPAAAALFRAAGARIVAAEARLRATAAPDAADIRRLRAALTDAQAQLDAAVVRIRLRLGYTDFLRDVPAHAIDAESRPGVPLVYLDVARHGAVGILVWDGGGSVEAVFGTLTDAELMEAATPFLTDPDADLDAVLDVLGSGLVAAVARRLAERDATGVVLVATGVLGVVPVHAARYGTPPRYLLDDVDVVYTPSARVLRAARASGSTSRAGPVQLVGVAEPLPCDPPLPWAAAELAAVAGLCAAIGGATEVVPSATATTDVVLRDGATHLHFAGHGRYNPAQPLESALELADHQRLTLRRLLDGRELDGVRLVVASACRTATTDMLRLPDEAIGLPAGLVQAGAAAVIGTLWEVNDRSAAVLITRFYVNHLRGDPDSGGPPLPVATALTAAQRWLAHADLDAVERFAAEVGLRRGRGSPRAREPSGRSATVVPFADPRHWAAFVLVGDGWPGSGASS